MKILITANSMWNIVNFRKDLVMAMIKRGHNLVVVAPEDSSVETLKSWGCRAINIDMDSKSYNILKNLILIIKFYQIFSDQKPDIIWSFTIKNNIFGSFAARKLAIPFIPNITGLGTAFLSNQYISVGVQILYKLAFQKSECVFFQNEDDKRLLQKFNIVGDNAIVIPGSGINLRDFKFSPLPGPETLKIIMVSRIIKDKGIREFLVATRKLKEMYPPISFSLIGSIDIRDKRSISISELEEWCHDGIGTYIGFIKNIIPELLDASLVVLPSYREGAPRVLIEAASLGRPCVTTDTAGCRSVVDDKITGYLCEAKNAKSLEEAIQKFIKLTHEEKVKMGLAARRKIESEFNVLFIILAYLKTLELVSRSHNS